MDERKEMQWLWVKNEKKISPIKKHENLARPAKRSHSNDYFCFWPPARIKNNPRLKTKHTLISFCFFFIHRHFVWLRWYFSLDWISKLVAFINAVEKLLFTISNVWCLFFSFLLFLRKMKIGPKHTHTQKEMIIFFKKH